MTISTKRDHLKPGRRMLALLIAAVALALSACGGSDDAKAGSTVGSSAAAGTIDPAYATLSGEIASIEPKRPSSLGEVELGEYKGIAIEAEEPLTISIEDARSYIETSILPYYLEETDEPAAEGMTVDIDFVGTMDGVEFEGGSAEAQSFVLGSGGYIDGFEDGIVGMTAGETKDVDVTFPEEYGNTDLAGKPATFRITLNSVHKQRELDDELASELNTDCSTVDEYLTFVQGVLQDQEDNNAEYELYDRAVEAVIAGSSVVEPSEDAIQWRMDETIVSDDSMLQSTYGMSLADYIYMYGMDLDDYREAIRENCENQVRQYLVTEAICDAEGFEADEANLEAWAAVNGVDMETVNATYDEDEAAIRCRAWLAAKYVAENGDVTYVSTDAAEIAETSEAEAE